jgi:dihydroorotase
MSLIIRGSVFTGGKVRQTGVRVEQGLVAAVGAGDLGSADRLIELKASQTLVPAGVDGQCALRDWGEAPRETVETGTRAALAGGITFVCDQCNTLPRIDNPELAERRTATLSAASLVDFAISAHPPRDPARLADYPGSGVYFVMLFPWDLKPWSEPPDTDNSAETFRRFAATGLRGMVSCDELALRDTALRAESETYALTALLRRLNPEWQVRIMITKPSSVEAIKAARARLPSVLAQSALHSVLMSHEEGYERIGSGAFHVPPLRPREEVERMRALAEAGDIDVIVSQHSPHRVVDKYRAEPIPGEYTPKAGYSAVDYSYPLLLSRLGFAAACATHSENPARHLGLNKGRIEKGFEADFAIVEEDPREVEVHTHVGNRLPSTAWRVDPMAFQSLAKVTPFVGERLKYRVMKTFLRGEEVYDAETKTFTHKPVRQLRLT